MGSRIPRKCISKRIRSILIDTPFPSFGTRSCRLLVPPLLEAWELMIVNNESSEIIRILNSAFDEFVDNKYAKRDFYPESLRKEIDEVNPWVYDLFNNGVYKVLSIPSLRILTVVWLCLCSISLYHPIYPISTQ